MSKMDAQRAMREARYEERAAAATRTPAPSAATLPPAARSTEEPDPPAESESPLDPLCGHRSINGRSCTREQGHSARSHRYS